MKKNKISVLILTQNSEQTLNRTLESVKNFDEIIVIDGGSTDSTEEIALLYNTIFIKNIFKGFSTQRNFALQQASSEWSLFIDSDEKVTENLREEIYNRITVENSNIYNIFRVEYFNDREVNLGFGRSCYQTRLFKTHEFSYRGNVHESPKPINSTEKFKILEIPMQFQLHHDPSRDLNEVLKRTFTYSKLTSTNKIKQGRTSNIFFIWLQFNYHFFRFLFKNRKMGFRGFLLGMAEVLHKSIVYLYIYEHIELKKEKKRNQS